MECQRYCLLIAHLPGEVQALLTERCRGCHFSLEQGEPARPAERLRSRAGRGEVLPCQLERPMEPYSPFSDVAADDPEAGERDAQAQGLLTGPGLEQPA